MKDVPTPGEGNLAQPCPRQDLPLLGECGAGLLSITYPWDFLHLHSNFVWKDGDLSSRFCLGPPKISAALCVTGISFTVIVSQSHVVYNREVGSVAVPDVSSLTLVPF